MKSQEYSLPGMSGYRQQAAADRWSTTTLADGLVWERFTVRAGDRWQDGGDSSDDKKKSERSEFRSLTEDTVGSRDIYVYRYTLLIPHDYPEFSPKQTFGQLHEGDYPIAFVRYERGVLEFVTNYKSGLNYRKQIPFTKGVPLALEVAVQLLPGENAGYVHVLADGKTIVSLPKHSLVEASSNTVYFKYGIYRSGMDAYAGAGSPPDQTVYYRDVSRTVIPAGASVPKPTPTPAAPAPSPAPVVVAPPTVPSESDLYRRISAAVGEIGSISAEVRKSYPAFAGIATQSSDKLVQLAAKMRAADAKAKT